MRMDQRQIFFKLKCSCDKSEQPFSIEVPSTPRDAASSQVQSANITKVTVEPSLELLSKDV